MGFLSHLNGIFVVLSLFCSTLFGCVATQLLPFLFILPLSRRQWKLWNQSASSSWYRFVVFLLEDWNGVKLIVSGDELSAAENALLLSNHPSELDWLYAWCLAYRYSASGRLKIAIKKELQYVPGTGWSIDNLDYILLSRKWESDEAQLKHSIQGFIDDKVPLWLLIYPEGTDFSKAKQAKSWEIADQNGYPKYKHMLLPRTKGFILVTQMLADSIDAIYDITVQYADKVTPTIWSMFCGTRPKVVNMHLRRFPISTIPRGDEELKKWCFDHFEEKDNLLDYFDKNGHFPGANKNNYLGQGPYPPPVVYFVMWMLIIILSIYGMWQSRLILWTFIGGWLLYASFAHSKKMRRWRGLDPPITRKQKKKD